MTNYRLPNNRETTSNVVTYEKAWFSIIQPVLDEFGWSLVAFNPNYVLSTKDKIHFTLPVDVAQAISDRLGARVVSMEVAP